MENELRTKVNVISVILESHPHADTLSIVHVYDYTVVVKTADWLGKDGLVAAYIPPDSLVPLSRPEFAWLGETTTTRYNQFCAKLVTGSTEPEQYVRVTARRFRKVLSYGLLVKLPEHLSGARVGDDVAEALGVLHYNPPESTSGGEAAPAPKVYAPKYDVASFQRYAAEIFTPGELVHVTEKLHGASGRWVFSGGRIHCGSRTEWKKEDESNLWWKALRSTPGLLHWLEAHPEIAVYGEVYGQVQNLKYGTRPGEVRIGVFDLLAGGYWVDCQKARLMAPDLPWVPVVAFRMPYAFDTLMDLAEGPSLVPGANHFREGIVIKPLTERAHESVGRVQLKIVSPSYLEKC